MDCPIVLARVRAGARRWLARLRVPHRQPVRRVFKQAWCWTWTRHADAVLVIEPGRLVALCSRCGWRSNGIAMP